MGRLIKDAATHGFEIYVTYDISVILGCSLNIHLMTANIQ